VEKRINQLEEKLLKQRGDTNDSKTISSWGFGRDW
jgi:hypothetical protein